MTSQHESMGAARMPPGAPPRAPSSAKGGKGGLIIGIFVGVLALGGIGGGLWYWLNSGAGVLAKYAPGNTQIYVELPSTLKGLVNAAGMDIIDDKELDTDARKKEIFEGFEESFGVKADEAEDVLTSVESIGFARYDLGKTDKETLERKSKSVMLIKFGSKGALETLLESKRFEKVGELAGGTQYRLYRKARENDDGDKEDKRNMFQKVFDDMGQRKPDKDEEESDSAKEFANKTAKKNTLVWFEGEKLIAVGDEEAVETVGKVIDGKEDSLTKNDQFKKASFPGGSALIVYYDPQSLDDKDLKKELFNETGPVTGSLRFDDAGIMMSAHVELRGKQAPKPEVLTEDQSFSLYEKLPANTVGYVAISGKLPSSGKDVIKALTKSLDDSDDGAGEKVKKRMEAAEEMLGFDLATVIDAVGDEAILAVTADEKTDVEVMKNIAKEGRDHLGMVLIVDVGDKEKAEKIVKGLKDAAEEKAKDVFEITKKDGGFFAELNEKMAEIIPVPGVWITLEKEKYVFIAVGKKKTIESMRSVFDGEGENLKGDKAHQKALSAVGAKGALMVWVDSGRILRQVLKELSDRKKQWKKDGLPIDAFRLEGDDRLTAAILLRTKIKDDLVTLEIDALNAPAMLPFSKDSSLRLRDEPKK